MQKNIIVLSHHSTQSNVQYAGGFHRLHEVLKRQPSNVKITCLDTYPSYLKNITGKDFSLIEYYIPPLIGKLTQINFLLGKIIERIYVFLYFVSYLVVHGSQTTVYVPFSELPHLSLAAIVAKIITGNKIVFCNLNPNPFFLDRWINIVSHRLSNLNITISKSLQAQLAKSLIFCKVVNPVGIDVKPRVNTSHINRIKTGIFIGRHTNEKGIYTALEVCAEVNKITPFKLYCVGNIPNDQSKKITATIKRLNIESKVEMLGILSEEKKLALLSRTNVCLFPSTQEGWGIVPQEALLCGVPVVAYDLPVYSENIVNCPAVTLVPVMDQKTFSRATISWLNIAKDQLKSKIDASQKSLSKFSWDSIARKEWEYICQI